MKISIITEDIMKQHHGYNLFDPELIETHAVFIDITGFITGKQLYEAIAEKMGIAEEFRLWSVEKNSYFSFIGQNRKFERLKSYRPCQFIEKSDMFLDLGPCRREVKGMEYYLLFMQLATKSTSYIGYNLEKPCDILFFLKYYDHESHRTDFKGTLIINWEDSIDSKIPEIRQRISYFYGKLNFYFEEAPDNIYKIEDSNMKLSAILQRQHCLQDGLVLVVEIALYVSPNNCVEQYYEDMYQPMEVDVFENIDFLNNTQDSFRHDDKSSGTINVRWSLRALREWLGNRINYDPEKILLWDIHSLAIRSSSQAYVNMYLTPYMMELHKIHNEDSTIQQILDLKRVCHDPRNKPCYKLFYTKLAIKVADLNDYYNIFGFKFMNNDLKEYDKNLIVKRGCKILDILDEAAKDFPFSNDGTGRLRIVEFSNPVEKRDKGYAPLVRILNNDDWMELQNTINGIYNYYLTRYNARIEEIPMDQLDVQPNWDWFFNVIPVAYFDFDTTQSYGVPFFVKILGDGEMFQDIRDRIKKKLNVSEEEFSHYMFLMVYKKSSDATKSRFRNFGFHQISIST